MVCWGVVENKKWIVWNPRSRLLEGLCCVRHCLLAGVLHWSRAQTQQMDCLKLKKPAVSGMICRVLYCSQTHQMLFETQEADFVGFCWSLRIGFSKSNIDGALIFMFFAGLTLFVHTWTVNLVSFNMHLNTFSYYERNWCAIYTFKMSCVTWMDFFFLLKGPDTCVLDFAWNVHDSDF